NTSRAPARKTAKPSSSPSAYKASANTPPSSKASTTKPTESASSPTKKSAAGSSKKPKPSNPAPSPKSPNNSPHLGIVPTTPVGTTPKHRSFPPLPIATRYRDRAFIRPIRPPKKLPTLGSPQNENFQSLELFTLHP